MDNWVQHPRRSAMFLETINHLCFEAASRFLHQPRLTRAIDLIIYLSKLVSQGRTKATRHVGNPRDEFVLMTFRDPSHRSGDQTNL